MRKPMLDERSMIRLVAVQPSHHIDVGQALIKSLLGIPHFSYGCYSVEPVRSSLANMRKV